MSMHSQRTDVRLMYGGRDDRRCQRTEEQEDGREGGQGDRQSSTANTHHIVAKAVLKYV